MSEDLSATDDAQLARWAYGRASTPDEQARALLAAAELQRRADAERERAERELAERAAAEALAVAVANGDVDAASSEHPEPLLTDSERRHRRRMLATGIAGITAAALALVAGVAVLSQPNPDPLAVFDSPETALDREWAAWISENLPVGAVLASRVLELDDNVVAVAFRAPAVADGSSTEWDPYCLFTTDSRDPAQAILTGGNCVLPEALTTRGLVAPIGIGLIEGAIDTLVWGPVGPPRVERDVQLGLEAQFAERSVVDILTFTSFQPSDALGFVDDPDRLLLGPAPLGSSTAGDGEVEAYGYLQRGGGNTADEIDSGAMFCLLLVANDETTTTTCDSLDSVRSVGLGFPLTVNGQSLIVGLGPDGTQQGLTWQWFD